MTAIYLDDTIGLDYDDKLYGYTDPSLQAINKIYYRSGGLTPAEYAKGIMAQSVHQSKLKGGASTKHNSHYTFEPNTDGTLDADRILKSMPAWKAVEPTELTPVAYHHTYHNPGNLRLPAKERMRLSERTVKKTLELEPIKETTSTTSNVRATTIGVRNDIGDNFPSYVYDKYFQTHGLGGQIPMNEDRSEMRYKRETVPCLTYRAQPQFGLLGLSVSLQ